MELAPPTMPRFTKIETTTAVEPYTDEKAHTLISQFVDSSPDIKNAIEKGRVEQADLLIKAFQEHAPGSPHFQNNIATILRDYGKETDEALSRFTSSLLDFPTKLQDENSAFNRTERDLASLTQIVSRNRADAAEEQANAKGFLARFARRVAPKATDKVELLIISNAEASDNVKKITDGLLSNKEALTRDITTLGKLQVGLWDSLISLYAREQIFETLKARVEEWEQELISQGRTLEAEAVRNQALLAVTKRLSNTVTQSTVNIQSYQGAKSSEDNLNKYIEGIEVAINTTLEAYKVNLYFTKVLGLGAKVEAQLSALDEATEQLILSNAKAIGETTVRLAERESQVGINPEVLLEAQNIMTASAQQALEIRSKAIGVLEQNTERVREARDSGLTAIQRQG